MSAAPSVKGQARKDAIASLLGWPLRILLLATVAAAVTTSVYSATLHYGFDYDDYHFVRPYSIGELRTSFAATWDPSGIEVPFFRPLTICFFAARFRWLGLNADAHHVLSLLLFGFAGLLLGVFVLRLCGRLSVAILAVITFSIHPGMPYAAVAWVTNQMHLLVMVGVFGSAIWWHFVRRKSAVWWMPLILAQMLLLMIKEDGVMLLPALIGLHLILRFCAEEDLPMPPAVFLVCGALSVGGLLAYRQSALHGVGGYRLPAAGRAWENLTRGLVGTYRLVPAKRPFQLQASWFVTIMPVLTLIAWRSIRHGIRALLLSGIIISLLFDLPFVFVVKPEQLHLVAAGGALVLAASITAVWDVTRRLSLRVALATISVYGLVAISMVTRNITRDFDPFGPIVLHHDRIVEGWAAVPVELREYIRAKTAAGARDGVPTNPATALRLVSFGVHGTETTPSGALFRWMSGPNAMFLVGSDIRTVRIPLRHEIGAFREPVNVSVTADGRLLDALLLADDAWHYATIALRPQNVSILREMHDVRVVIDHAWVPARVIPGSTDPRMLGLQIGELQLQ